MQKVAQKRVAAVNDMSCFGKCSLTVALPLLSRFGLEAVPLPTAILSTHTGGFQSPSILDMTEEMRKIIAHWKSVPVRFDCVYTGYLLGQTQVEMTRDFARAHASRGALVLVDPVMADNGRLYAGFHEDYPRHMRALCALADVVTPNVTEAALLAGLPYAPVQTPAFLRACAEAILGLGAKACVITGARPNEREICDLAFAQKGGLCYEETRPYVPRGLHGCGDVFSSVLCARLLRGESLAYAARRAAAFTGACIEETMRDIDNHFYGLKFESLMDDAHIFAD